MARKQQQKARQTRDELMATAMRLFERKGFAGTTVAEITRRSGYAKGSFYRHWRSKAELFLHIVEAKLAAHRERRDERIGRAGDLDEAMHVIWDFLEGIIQDRDWSRNMLEFTVMAARDADLRAELTRSSNRLSNEVFAPLVQGHLETDYPPEKIGALNTALFEGFLIHAALGTGTLDVSDVRAAAVALARHNGLAPGRGNENKASEGE